MYVIKPFRPLRGKEEEKKICKINGYARMACCEWGSAERQIKWKRQTEAVGTEEHTNQGNLQTP